MGSDNAGYEEIMVQQGLGEMNDKGKRFADLCATSKLVIGGSFFYHRVHKATWVSPHQIDHMCIEKKFYRTLQDVRIRCEAGFASDHHLLIALKMRRNWTEGTNQRLGYNTTLLKDTNKREEVNIAHPNKFQVLQELLEGEM